MENPNFHSIAKERQQLRGDLLLRSGEAWKDQKKSWQKEDGFEGIAQAIEEGNIYEFLGGQVDAQQDPDSHIKKRLRELDETAEKFDFSDGSQVAGVRKERTVEKKQNEKFEKISRELFSLEKIEEANIRAEFNVAKRSHGEFSDADKDQLKQIVQVQKAIEKRRSMLKENPETHAYCRMHELKNARREMTEFGFASLGAKSEDIGWIRKRWEEGSAVLLEGPTGTGKTELLNYLAKKLYRTNAQVLRCTERTGPAEIFGKTLLEAAGSISNEKVDEMNREIENKLSQWSQNNPDADEKAYHAVNERFLRLMTMGFEGTKTFFQPGRYVTAIDRGVPLLMDEFNQLPTNMRFSLKELYNRKAGDEIVIQEDTGKPHRIKEGFAWGATANIKSGKHKERFDLDGAESRVFDMRHIEYMSEDKLYDMSITMLMDKNGGALLSQQEAKTTLKFLVDCAKEIQRGYAEELTVHYGMTSARGEKPSLEKAVLDPGSVMHIISGYKTEAVKGVALIDYLDERLLDFVSKGDYPEKDRELMVRILMSKGFFQNMPAENFKLKTLDEKALKSFRSAKQEKEKSTEEKYLTLAQIAELDPYGKRIGFFGKLGDEFLGDAKEPPKDPRMEGKIFEQIAVAQEIMERNGKEFFLGPENIEETFGINLRPEDIDSIPFSKAEIEHMQSLGHGLAYEMDEMPDGTPFNIENMAKGAIKVLGSNVLEKDAKGKPSKYLLYKDQFEDNGSIKSSAWFSGESGVLSQKPRRGWHFFSADVLPDSKNKQALAQIKVLIENAKNNFFAGNFPTEYAEAEEEYESKKTDIKELIKAGNRVDASKAISELKISDLLSEPVQNTIFRYLVSFKKGKQLFTDGNYSRSMSGISSDGNLLPFGYAASTGAGVYRSGPGHARGNLGAVSSRF